MAATRVLQRQQSTPLEPLFLETMLDMGFPEAEARTALYETHNVSVEAAVQWIVNHPQQAQQAASLRQEQVARLSSNGSLDLASGQPVVGLPSCRSLVIHPDGESSQAMVVGVSGDVKVVLVVNAELGMSPGKVAAQCAHGGVGIYQAMMQDAVPWLPSWEDNGQRTVVVSAPSASQLSALAQQCEELELLTYQVRDAGHTEVQAGSLTVLAVAGFSEIVNKVTGTLPLW